LLSKGINSLLRIGLVLFLIYPLPIAIANHVATQAPYDTNASNDGNAGTFTIGILGSDGFEDSPPESYTIFFSTSSGITETNSFCVTTSFGHQDNTWQYHTFSLDNLKYYFNDPAGNNIYYRVRGNNVTDYSFSELSTEKAWNLYAGPPYDYNQTDWSAPTVTDACDDPKILDGIGDPSNLTVSTNLHTGAITIDWVAPANIYEYSPERYAIGFDKKDPPMYGIATGNVGDENALNTEYTFTKSYLQAALDAQVGDTIYFEIRSDNDTNAQYSTWTTLASYTIQDVASGVTNLTISNTQYQGLDFSWTQPNTGWSAVESYKIEYKLSSEETYRSIDIADASATSYTMEDISAETYDFVVYSCTDSGSYCHGGQAGPVTNYEVLSTTATTTTTTTTTIYVAPEPPPPPPTTLAPVVIVMDDGSESEYTQDQVEQGDVERDNERKANEDKWGCYVTNVALERGDCESYNESLNPKEETIDEETIDDKIVEEVKDEKIIEDRLDNDEDIIEDTSNDIDIVIDTETEVLEDDGQILEKDVLENDFEDVIDVTDDTEIITDDTEIITDETEITPIKEDFVDVDLEPESIPIDTLDSEMGDEEVQLTDEEVAVIVEETEKFVKEIVNVEIDSDADFDREGLSEAEIVQAEEKAQKEYEDKVAEVVAELPTEKKVEVVKEVAKTKVQNLANADKQTKAVVKAVVKEVTKTETVAQLSEEEKKDVGKVLGFEDETAAKDVEIISVAAEKEVNIAQAVDEYVDRAIENNKVENYTLADVVTEIAVEQFIANPIGALVDVELNSIDFSNIGNDMTNDQKEKSQEVVVPVIIASQIIASAGSLTRRIG
jgi:hypothetical protein